MEFTKKVSSLLCNQFLKEGLKVSNETLSENGALKYSTSGNAFVDNFASISKFRYPRTYEDVAKDMNHLWSLDPILTVKLTLYIRLITRKSQVVTYGKTEVLDVQRGQGLRNEGIMRMLWLAIYQSNTFKANIPLFIAAGSWKDIITMLNLDLQYHGWNNRKLDWDFMRKVLYSGLINLNTTHLVRKYLPTIRTNSKCKTLESQADTLIGRWLAKSLFKDLDNIHAYKEYRKCKAKGLAHQWQQLISKQLYNDINFDKIAGRALSLLVNSKFLDNHNLIAKYSEWIKSKPIAKYTGFIFELFKPLGEWIHPEHIEYYKEATINAQFTQLVKTGKENINTNSNLIVVRDTSGSMASSCKGCNMTAFGIAKAMALYFSEFLTGAFTNAFIEFSDIARLHYWKGDTPCDKWINDKCSSYANTNFQSVIDLFINLKNQGIPESEFPAGILALSDGEFDSCGSNKVTNFQEALRRLREAGFSEKYVSNFKIILWDIHSYGRTKFEDFADAPNFFYMSGYDPSIIAFLLEGKECKVTPKNAEELMYSVLNQELLNKVVIK